MELECQKYKEKMAAEEASCRHPHDYCKFRTSCIIQFISGERHGSARDGRKEEAAPPEENDEGERMSDPNFNKAADGLLPAIAQDHETGEVLMLAYINKEAWRQTLATGKAHYWSRSRKKIWLKGESSGHVQLIKEIRLDCDADTVLYRVEQLGGAACHEGYKSCFFRRVAGSELVIAAERVFDPEKVYG